MRRRDLLIGTIFSAAAVFSAPFAGTIARAPETAADLKKESALALQTLYRTNPIAKTIAGKARAVLVFPKIVKAGLVFGGSYGDGVLMQGPNVTQGPRVLGYYNSISGSLRLQAGAQSYGYALFLMDDNAMLHLNQSQGWELGIGPTVAVNEGIAQNVSTSTARDDVYAFIFDRQGLMLGVSIEGTKVTRIDRS